MHLAFTSEKLKVTDIFMYTWLMRLSVTLNTGSLLAVCATVVTVVCDLPQTQGKRVGVLLSAFVSMETETQEGQVICQGHTAAVWYRLDSKAPAFYHYSKLPPILRIA